MIIGIYRHATTTNNSYEIKGKEINNFGWLKLNEIIEQKYL